MIEVPAGPLSPEGQARLDKHGFTLDDQNVRLVTEHIDDYPEIIAAVHTMDGTGRPAPATEAQPAEPPPPTGTRTGTAEPDPPEGPRPVLTAYDVASIRSVAALHLHDADRLTASMTRTIEHIVKRRLADRGGDGG